jgi:hypothetical protein
MLDAADSRLSRAGSTLSQIAGSDELFLKQNRRPTFDGCSLNQIVCLLAAAQEAITTLSDCRLQYGDEWLLAQGQMNGLMLDGAFIANYEHLLLQLEAELIEAFVQKALENAEKPPREGHDKKQQKRLSWFTEFAEKPRPLGSSFPWSIKPSLAVLWGVSRLDVVGAAVADMTWAGVLDVLRCRWRRWAWSWAGSGSRSCSW